MHQEVPHGDLARHVRVGEPEPREVTGNRSIPFQFSFFDKHADRRRSERLGVRCDAEQRVPVHAPRLPQRTDAVAAGEDNAAVLYDGKPDPRDTKGGADTLDEVIEPRGRSRLRTRHRGAAHETGKKNVLQRRNHAIALSLAPVVAPPERSHKRRKTTPREKSTPWMRCLRRFCFHRRFPSGRHTCICRKVCPNFAS